MCRTRVRADGDGGQPGFGIPGGATLEYFLEVENDGKGKDL